MKKSQNQVLKLLLFIIFIQLTTYIQSQKTYVNKEWRDEYGGPVFNPSLAPYGGDWTKSIITSTNDIVSVGHTAISGQGENVLISRHTEDGTLIWQTNFNSASNFNDYGVDVFEAINGDLYVCGTTNNGGITDYDVLILIFNSNGSLIYNTSFDYGLNKNDIPSAISTDSGGNNILVAGTTEGSTTGYDYLVVSYDLSLSFNWKNTYDYSNLNDVAVEFVLIGPKMEVAGASANSLTDWDMTVVMFDETNGNLLGDNRLNYPGFGYDEVYSFCKDANNNTYITGKCSSNGINYDIRVAKISATNSLLWSQTYDAHVLEDVGSSIAVDQMGNVIVGGYITKPNNKKSRIILKYDSNGTYLWDYSLASHDPSSDAIVKAIALNPSTNDIYLIGGEKEIGNGKRAIVSRINPSGRVIWEKYIKGSYDYLPSDIIFGGYGTPGIYAITIKDSSVNAYELNYFTEHKLDTANTYEPNGKPAFPSRQLITRFDTSALIKPTINNKHIVCGSIEDFVKSSVVEDLKNNLASIYGTNDFDIKAYKIFPELVTTNSITISRLGDTIEIPEFYAVLLLELPNSLNVISAANNMLSLFPNIIYSHPNWACTVTASEAPYDFARITAIANDSLYSQQASLHPTGTYTNAHINVEEAWDLETGKRHVKLGVFDTGAYWKHKDFMDSTNTITKITGWDFYNGAPLINDPIGESLNHGTQVCGVIGANRNNIKGVAGIASGNFKQSAYIDSSGVNLHAMRTFTGAGYFLGSTYLDNISDAIVGSAIDNPSANSYNYGLHVMNHSWRISSAPTNTYISSFMLDTNITLLREATHFVNRAKVTFVAATGNEGLAIPSYPATIDDDWVLTVGGTKENGQYNNEPGYPANIKNNIDVCAPGRYNIIWTLGWSLYSYWDVGGTSMAAPHVSGAAGLLMSYLNKPYADPSNLAPEDIEFILQKTATDINVPNYDDTTGWGRINVGKALKLIQKPKRKVKHFGTDNSTHNTFITYLPSNDTVIKLTERYKNAAGIWFIPNRKYHVKSFQVTSYVYHNLLSTEKILHAWARPSSTNVLEFKSLSKIRPRERINLLLAYNGYAHLTGFVYQVRDSLGTPLGWWPFDTTYANTKMKLTYSLLVEDTAFDVGVAKQPNVTNPRLKIFPNPTNGNQTLFIFSEKDTYGKVIIYDVLGREVYSSNQIHIDEGENSRQIPTNGLPKGMYIYNIILGEEELYFKILKE